MGRFGVILATGSGLRILLLLMACCFIQTKPVLAEEPASFAPVILEQEPAPGNVASSSTPVIRVKFQDAAQLKKEAILMEVDRGDVSAFAQFAEGTLSYQPPAPLQPGAHEVRISGNLADGRKLQEITWSFSIPQAPSPRSWQVGLEPSVAFEYKIREDSTMPERHRFNSNIAINTNRSGLFQSSFTTNLQAQDPNPGSTPKDFDLVNYQANFVTGQTTISLGDVVVNDDLLSISSLARRGVYFQQRLPFLSSGFDFFSVRSETIIGFVHGLGFSNSKQRVDGGSYFFSPLQRPQQLNLRFYYLRGENEREQGFNFGGITRGFKGNAFGMNLTSSLFTNQFRIEGYTAWSDFDFNASDEFSGNDDHALQAKFIFDPAPKTWKNRPSKFFAQLELQDLGTFFKSLGNPFLVGDRRGLNLNSAWNVGIFGLTGGVAKFRDNVSDLTVLPTVDNIAYSAGFTITPLGTTGPPQWPSFSLTTTRSKQDSRGEAVSFLAIDTVVDTVAALVQLNRTKWNLNWNTSFSVNNDKNNRVPDTDAKSITVGAFFFPAPFWNLGPSVSFTRQGNRESDIDNDLWTFSGTASIPIQPERINLDSQFSYSTTESSDLLNQSSNFSGTAQISYNLHHLWKTPGRQALALRFSYNRFIIDAPFASRQKGFEIFGLLDLSWPFR